MKKLLLSLFLGFIFVLTACATTVDPDTLPFEDEVEGPKYIFYFIGDGMGMNHVTFLEEYLRWKNDDAEFRVSMTSMPVLTSLATSGIGPLIPDSGAAGTMLATGQMGANSRISMNEAGTVAYTTILQALQAANKSVGLITDVRATHATPASFGANVVHRDDELEVATQYLASEIDFIAGGGSSMFLPEDEGGRRPEGENLISDFSEKGYTVNLDKESFQQTDFTTVERYLGLYESSHLTNSITQNNNVRTSPTLGQMLTAGIEVLSQNEEGFFVMVEGGYIDMASHDNDTAATLHEMLEFEDAIQVALEFYYQNPEDTLIIATADHETGNIGVGFNSSNVNWVAIDAITVSFANEIAPYFEQDHESFFNAIETHWNLTLTDFDKEAILNRFYTFDLVGLAEDMGFPLEHVQQMDSMRHMLGIEGYAAAPVLFGETKVTWSSQAHTAARVPLAAIGQGSEAFQGARHLTDVPNILAELTGVEIGQAR